MIYVRFIFGGLLRRWGSATLTITVGALGLAGLILILWAQTALPEAIMARISETDMVVGPKASGLDLTLCCALHQTPAPGLVSLKSIEMRLAEPDIRPLIKQAVPIGLGDSVEGRRIVWTYPEIVTFYHAQLVKGRIWNRPLQIVAGAEAARALNLQVGQSLVSSHGLSVEGEVHDAKYAVTGILAPTGGVLDQLLLSDLTSIARVHEHITAGTDDHTNNHDQETTADRVNAVLVKFSSPIAQASAPVLINESDTLSATSPHLELARLMSLVRPIVRFMTALFGALAIVGSLVLTLTLVQALNRRARDLSLLRFLGASRLDLGLIGFAEALILVHGALLLSITISIAGQYGVREMLLSYGLTPRLKLSMSLLLSVYGSAMLVAAISATVPAIRLYYTRDDEGFRS